MSAGQQRLDLRQLNRRDLLRAGGATALGLAAAPLLSACGGGSSTPAGTSGSPSRGGSLTVGWVGAGSAETLNPQAVGTSYPDHVRAYNLYNYFFVKDADGNAAGDLVAEAEPNSDSTVWTLRLRDDVTWHDGRALTAADAVYTLTSWTSPEHGARSALTPIIDYAGIRTLDRHTVEIPLLRGVAQFPSLLTRTHHMVVPDGADLTSNTVGTGPFVFDSFQAGSRSVFRANDDYFDGRPYVDELVVASHYRDEEARTNALLADEIQAMPNAPFTFARSQLDGGTVTILDHPGPQVYCLAMNLSVAPFTDPRVVRALRLVADRQQLVDNVLAGFGTVGNDLAPSGVEYFADDLTISRDLDEATSLLRQAGVEDLTIPLYTSTTFGGQNEAAVLFQQQAREAGITVDLTTLPTDTFYTAAGGWPGHAMSSEAWVTPLSSLTQWYMTVLSTTATFQQTHWATDDTDALLRDAMADTDPSTAAEKWHVLQERQFDSGGYLVYANGNWVDALSPRLAGIEGSRAGYLGGLRLHRAWLSS